MPRQMDASLAKKRRPHLPTGPPHYSITNYIDFFLGKRGRGCPHGYGEIIHQFNNLVGLHIVAAHIVPNLGALIAAVSPVIACIDVGVVTTFLLNQAIALQIASVPGNILVVVALFSKVCTVCCFSRIKLRGSVIAIAIQRVVNGRRIIIICYLLPVTRMNCVRIKCRLHTCTSRRSNSPRRGSTAPGVLNGYIDVRDRRGVCECGHAQQRTPNI